MQSMYASVLLWTVIFGLIAIYCIYCTIDLVVYLNNMHKGVNKFSYNFNFFKLRYRLKRLAKKAGVSSRGKSKLKRRSVKATFKSGLHSGIWMLVTSIAIVLTVTLASLQNNLVAVSRSSLSLSLNESDDVAVKDYESHGISINTNGYNFNTGTSVVNSINAQNEAKANQQKDDVIKNLLNTAELHPHYAFPYVEVAGTTYPKRTGNIYEMCVTERDIAIIDKFAQEHFTDQMSRADKIEYLWTWMFENCWYAKWADYSKYIAPYDNVEATLEHKAGQCLQYNGCLATLMAYMGYDVYLVHKLNPQHYFMEVVIDGTTYSCEVGSKSESPWHEWFVQADKKNGGPNSLYDFGMNYTQFKLPLTDWRKADKPYKGLFDHLAEFPSEP